MPPVGLTWEGSIDWDEDDWRARAACRHSGPDLFFPPGATGLFQEDIRAAKAICHACQAKAACLEFALATKQEAGVWGATSEDERRVLRERWLADRAGWL